jgi:hypothetical protein
MGRTTARLVVGMGMVAVALLAGRQVTASDSATVVEVPKAPVVLHGAVGADGSLVAPQGGVSAGRVADGSYLVAAEGSREVVVVSWEAVGEVVVTPVGAGVSLVRFTDTAGVAVNSGFSFTASS